MQNFIFEQKITAQYNNIVQLILLLYRPSAACVCNNDFFTIVTVNRFFVDDFSKRSC